MTQKSGVEELSGAADHAVETAARWTAFIAKLTTSNRDMLMQMSQKDSWTIRGNDGKDVVIHRRQIRKLTWAQNDELQTMRAELEEMPALEQKEIEDPAVPGKKMTITVAAHRVEAARMAAVIYSKMAEYYLGWRPAQYYDLPWTETKNILDLFAWEEANGRPFRS